MTPTLAGRIQTRIVLLATLGVPWTLLVVPLLPGDVRYQPALVALTVIAVLGVGWELIYHACQQLRWDKDWPSLFALLAGIPEGAVAYPVLGVLGLAPPSVPGHVLYFGSTWLLIWLVMQGPLRVLAPRWRHTGGRLLSHLPGTARLRRSAGQPARRTVPGQVGAVMAVAALLSLVVSSGPAESGDLPSGRPGGLAPAGAGVGPAADPARLAPAEVTVPRIGASSTLIPLGLAEDGALQTPPVSTPMQAGWYALGPAPGEAGPAVIVGHVDGLRRPGIFFRLGELVPGDEIVIRRADASLLHFIVTRISQVPKDRFPTDEVYGPTTGPELRLITCGGSFDRDARSYRDNLIVFAVPRDAPMHG
jgi:hypothetical protein